MDQITVDTSIYEFTREIKIRPTDKAIDAHCVYCLHTDYNFSNNSDDYEEEHYVLIEELFVPFKYRRQDIGRALLRAAVSDAHKRYPSMAIKLVVEPLSPEIDQNILVDFYESEGFSIEQDHDVIIMSC
jgi:GNAT superfamily N-acetyltransferase